MAELNFYSGTMDCGKSTLALQMDYTHAQRGRIGRVFTSRDRAGEATLSSRLGLEVDAIEVTPELHFWQYVVDALTHGGSIDYLVCDEAQFYTRQHVDQLAKVVDELSQGGRIDYLVCDEAQFYTRQHVDELAKVVDELSIDVYAFGILTDFRSRLFEGSQRLVELADRVHTLQVEALCWCGRRGTHNARTEDGEMVTEGEVIVVGDVEDDDRPVPSIGYEVLCRRHHRRNMTAAAARAAALSPDVLPFG